MFYSCHVLIGDVASVQFSLPKADRFDERRNAVDMQHPWSCIERGNLVDPDGPFLAYSLPESYTPI